MSSTNNYILGVYDDEDEVLHAVSEVKSKGIKHPSPQQIIFKSEF